MTFVGGDEALTQKSHPRNVGPFRLLVLVRQAAVHETWIAEDQRLPVSPPILLHRLTRSSMASDIDRLHAVFQKTRAFRHPNVLRPREMVVVGTTPEVVWTLEPHVGVTLFELIEHRRALHEELPVALSLWIARELARTLADAAVDAELVRSPISTDDIVVDARGRVRIHGFALLPRLAMRRNARQIACECIRGALKDMLGVDQVRGQWTKEFIPGIVWLLSRLATPEKFDALRSLEDALSRVFYRDLWASDGGDGSSPLALHVQATEKWLSARLSLESRVHSDLEGDATLATLPERMRRGSSTRTFWEANGLLVPRPIGPDDRDGPPTVSTPSYASDTHALAVEPDPTLLLGATTADGPRRSSDAHASADATVGISWGPSSRPVVAGTSMAGGTRDRRRTAIRASVWIFVGFFAAWLVVLALRLLVQNPDSVSANDATGRPVDDARERR